jgi:hypothetical protein
LVEIEVQPVPPDAGEAVLAAAESLGLVIGSDGSLSKYPGSRHWHLKKPGATGTLEITHWPAENRLWVTYHANRTGDGWVEEAAAQLAAKLSEAG